MSRCGRRPSFVETAVRIVRMDCAVRPSLPMTLPTSSFATRSSIRLLCSPAISVTTTWSGWSTSSIAIVWISSLSAIAENLAVCERARGMKSSLGCGGLELRQALEQTIDRLRRGRAVLTPVLQAVMLDDELAGILRRVVGTDVLEETPAPRAPLIGDNETVKRLLLGARAGETNMNGHDEKPFGATASFDASGPPLGSASP